jgi:hypothetical protein
VREERAQRMGCQGQGVVCGTFVENDQVEGLQKALSSAPTAGDGVAVAMSMMTAERKEDAEGGRKLTTARKEVIWRVSR